MALSFVSLAPVAAAQESTIEPAESLNPSAANTSDDDGSPSPSANVANAPRLLIRYRATERAQLAIWLEDEEGNFLRTLGLTEATALRGIGNRPGASQMNSGFRWPYGRREGVLPIWAYRRLQAPDNQPFRRVIFQDRDSEGMASRTTTDSSPDDYSCLSFMEERSSRDALDAVSCATVFSSDKGRFITEGDIARGYAEPFEDPATGEGLMRPLSLDSGYPPRRDVRYCSTCTMHSDVAEFQAHALEVMPELDAVTMATPKGDAISEKLVVLDQETSDAYRLCVEANVEGDYNDAYNDETYPTPRSPAQAWDDWAMDYGYPYRGQPSIVYCAPFDLSSDASQPFGVAEPEGTVDGWDIRTADYGALHPMEDISDDPVGAPGQGADRLGYLPSGNRLEVEVLNGDECDMDATPTEVQALSVAPHGDELHVHEWIQLSFASLPGTRALHRYDVRVSTMPIVDPASFIAAEPAKAATIQAEELQIPTTDTEVQVELGGLVAKKHYYIAVRAVDNCAIPGPIAVVEYETPARKFTTVSPCFVATAAYGSPMHRKVGTLRRFRDRYLLTHAPGRALVHAYYSVGPTLAGVIDNHSSLREASRQLLSPLVDIAAWLDDTD